MRVFQNCIQAQINVHLVRLDFRSWGRFISGFLKSVQYFIRFIFCANFFLKKSPNRPRAVTGQDSAWSGSLYTAPGPTPAQAAPRPSPRRRSRPQTLTLARRRRTRTPRLTPPPPFFQKNRSVFPSVFRRFFLDSVFSLDRFFFRFGLISEHSLVHSF